jgi:hypothetical protein
MLLTFFYLLAHDVARAFLLAISATSGGILFQLFAKLLHRLAEGK